MHSHDIQIKISIHKHKLAPTENEERALRAPTAQMHKAITNSYLLPINILTEVETQIY